MNDSTPRSPAFPLSDGLSARTATARGGAISYLMRQAVEHPECLSLAAGLVDRASLPVDLARDLAADLLGDPEAARDALQYGHTAGNERLRAAVAELFAGLEGRTGGGAAGLNPAAPGGRVVLTNGSQQFLSLAAEVLLDPGDICLVAAPTYFVMLGVLAGVGARAVSVDTDGHGMRPDGLERRLTELEAAGELPRVKLIYLVPEFENPSGVRLAADRRAAIVRLAGRFSKTHRVRILEDSAYRELRYDGDPYPSVWSCDTGGDVTGSRVLYTQTFSKSFAPGLRVGFGILPPDLVGPVLDRKGNEDFGSSHLTQHLVLRALESGRYAGHVASVRAAYRAKRDALLAGLDEHLGDLPGVSWLRPDGGLYVWATLPDGVETGFDSPLFRTAAEREHVMYVPGELCHAKQPGPVPTNQMRLSFGVLAPDALHEAAARLGRAVRSCL